MSDLLYEGAAERIEAVSKSSALNALIREVSKSIAAIISIRYYVCGRGKHGWACCEAGVGDIRASRLEACRNLASKAV